VPIPKKKISPSGRNDKKIEAGESFVGPTKVGLAVLTEEIS
jgi:hypothetical protein